MKLKSSPLDETIERTESGDNNHFDYGTEPLIEDNKNETKGRTCKPTSVADLLTTYGKCFALSGLAGGSACIPNIGPAGTLFEVKSTSQFHVLH